MGPCELSGAFKTNKIIKANSLSSFTVLNERCFLHLFTPSPPELMHVPVHSIQLKENYSVRAGGWTGSSLMTSSQAVDSP